jgi:hypothetical protein
MSTGNTSNQPVTNGLPFIYYGISAMSGSPLEIDSPGVEQTAATAFCAGRAQHDLEGDVG